MWGEYTSEGIPSPRARIADNIMSWVHRNNSIFHAVGLPATVNNNEICMIIKTNIDFAILSVPLPYMASLWYHRINELVQERRNSSAKCKKDVTPVR